MSDENIVKEIHANLEKDPRINLHRYPITIAIENGDLILAGDVENIAAKKLALVEAAEIHGVQRIVDRLLCGCQVTNTRNLFFSYDSFTSPTKERLAAMRGTAHGRHTDSECAPL